MTGEPNANSVIIRAIVRKRLCITADEPLGTNCAYTHGLQKDFFQKGALGDFSKIFLGVAKSGDICFFPLETNFC